MKRDKNSNNFKCVATTPLKQNKADSLGWMYLEVHTYPATLSTSIYWVNLSFFTNNLVRKRFDQEEYGLFLVHTMQRGLFHISHLKFLFKGMRKILVRSFSQGLVLLSEEWTSWFLSLDQSLINSPESPSVKSFIFSISEPRSDHLFPGWTNHKGAY